jgi:hypothetical protein
VARYAKHHHEDEKEETMLRHTGPQRAIHPPDPLDERSPPWFALLLVLGAATAALLCVGILYWFIAF